MTLDLPLQPCTCASANKRCYSAMQFKQRVLPVALAVDASSVTSRGVREAQQLHGDFRPLSAHRADLVLALAHCVAAAAARGRGGEGGEPARA